MWGRGPALCKQNYLKLLDHPNQKPRRGGGLKQISTCRKVPLQLNFLDDDISHCFLSIKSFYGVNQAKYQRLKHKRYNVSLMVHVMLFWAIFIYCTVDAEV